jgi:hypothetical protein
MYSLVSQNCVVRASVIVYSANTASVARPAARYGGLYGTVSVSASGRPVRGDSGGGVVSTAPGRVRDLRFCCLLISLSS